MTAHHTRSQQLLARVLPARPGLVALGGSNTVVDGLGSKSPDRWPDRVGRQLGVRAVTLGRAGGTIRESYDRGTVEKALAAGAPFITVGFGVDDCLSLDLGEFTSLLDRLIREIETTGATPLVLTGLWLEYPAHFTVQHWDDALDPFNAAIRAATSRPGPRLVDVAARMKKENAKALRDLQVEGQMVVGSRMTGHLVVQAIRSHEVVRARPGKRRAAKR